MRGRHRPAYDLAIIKERVREGRWTAEGPALRGSAALEMDSEDIVECVTSLTRGDFHKTMASQSRPGMFHDVYKPFYYGQRLYVKVQLADDGDAVVIQFKAADD